MKSIQRPVVSDVAIAVALAAAIMAAACGTSTDCPTCPDTRCRVEQADAAPEIVPDCDDGIACTIDEWSPVDGCVHSPASELCDDGNACTTDTCHPVDGCLHLRELDCPDGELCFRGECVRPDDASRLLDAGYVHTCAIDRVGDAWCWGLNAWGELGAGCENKFESLPVKVQSFGLATNVAVGEKMSFGVRADGRVWEWGPGPSWASPHDEVDCSHWVTQTEGLSGIAEVAASDEFRCALEKIQRVYCWGHDQYGQLGYSETSHGCYKAPVKVVGVDSAVDLAVGSAHACVVLEDGGVQCWGSNYAGQLGYLPTEDEGTTAFAGVPQVVPSLPFVVRIAIAGPSTCGLTEQREVWCWGSGHYGRLGRGAFAEVPGLPAKVPDFHDVVAVDGHGETFCAIRGDGSVWCWGRNHRGQLGIGNEEDSPVPVQVVGLQRAVAVAVGDWHVCALLESGAIWCWGANYKGQLGNGTTEGSSVPVQVLLPATFGQATE